MKLMNISAILIVLVTFFNLSHSSLSGKNKTPMAESLALGDTEDFEIGEKKVIENMRINKKNEANVQFEDKVSRKTDNKLDSKNKTEEKEKSEKSKTEINLNKEKKTLSKTKARKISKNISLVEAETSKIQNQKLNNRIFKASQNLKLSDGYIIKFCISWIFIYAFLLI
jgi:hypothetical protein